MAIVRGILFSVVLHILILVFVSRTSTVKRPDTVALPVTVDVVKSKSKEPGLQRKATSGHSKKMVRKLELFHLKFQPLDSQGLPSTNGHWGLGLSDNVRAPWGEGGSEFLRVVQFGLMKRIQTQIEGLLYYPGVLAAHGIEGVVNVRLVLGSQGECRWRQTKISSSNIHLRFFVLDLVKKFCVQSFKEQILGRNSTNVDLSFRFSITEGNEEEIKREQTKIVGNVLLFYRNSHQSVAQWHLGPFTGLFPLPWVALDWGWVVENWERLVENNDLMDEFRGTRSL